jgi:hypothetical protein
VFALLIQTLPHQREGVGDGRVAVEKLALFSSDLMALTLGARGALHDSSWPLYTGIASLLIWRVVGQFEVLENE